MRTAGRRCCGLRTRLAQLGIAIRADHRPGETFPGSGFGEYRGHMFFRRVAKRTASVASRVASAALAWARRAYARRKARLAALRRPDELLVEAAHRARDEGAPYDTWRQALPVARRAGGGMGGM